MKTVEKCTNSQFIVCICFYCQFLLKLFLRLSFHRLQTGMRGAYGKPQGTVARVNIGQPIMSVRSSDKFKPAVIEALRRAKFKFPGRQKIYVSKKWGFTKYDREEYETLRDQNRYVVFFLFRWSRDNSRNLIYSRTSIMSTCIISTPKIGIFPYLSRNSYFIRGQDHWKCSNNETNNKENNIENVFFVCFLVCFIQFQNKRVFLPYFVLLYH
jgi:Ribosomal protein L16/L10E